eukprot:TRINITY_DN61306_c0_g1_i1.p2 TRINITY_DN61306_c0_g1~~TRINITY_DN61306_c0_g1_i1.p2  ORF type:complete len:166 (-),score=26.80 TRINITY_DN61306_c0_g1_i1:230-727(-)
MGGAESSVAESSSLFGGSAEDDLDSWCDSLSFTDRMYAAGACMCASIVFGGLASACMWTLSLTSFALYYTASSLFGVACTCFLRGPEAQYKSMSSENRAGTVLVYFGSILFVLLSALVIGSALLTMMGLGVQMAAGAWYTLSFVPGGQTCIGALLPSWGGYTTIE